MHYNLPHINQKNLYQFITFRTKDSIDDYIRTLTKTDLPTKKLQQTIDTYLDTSKKGAYLNDVIITIVKDYLLNLDKNKCDIISFIIMPNHIHILLIQKQNLSDIIQYIKGGLSFIINKKLNKKGTFWQKDYFDRVIRDEKHFELTYNYIKNNAIKANLKDAKERFFSIYE